ncbi:tail completion protein gp17 [Pelistega ratti]|uniref:tail completion protein gp17 n=1 Tax=Pelistega ratti TaxID=2652177 RepID=UPI00135B8B57|nr:DUF3168 domain-containing protein [Pelistega ratti]
MTEDELAQRLSAICPTFPIYMPQDNEVFPAIVYSVVAVNTNSTICGPTDEDKRVQIDCYAKTYADLLMLRDDVLDALLDADKVNDFDAFVENSTLFRRTLEFYI